MNLTDAKALPKGWLAFELNVLRRLKFGSVSLPLVGDPALGAYLKRYGVRVAANDFLQSNWTKATAFIQNNSVILTEEQVAAVLEDAYVPRHRLYNPALRNWLNETDSWWFDNVRENIERLDSPFARAIALSIGMAVGDYVLSFDDKTSELRQPLTQVYRRVWNTLQPPFDNGKTNSCSNRDIKEFLAEVYADVMFLRLPPAHNTTVRASVGWTAWREEWTRGTDSFWDSIETSQTGRLGTHVQTKFQYLRLVEDLLQSASHIKQWTIAHVEDGFITSEELVETVTKVRRVETIFSKDFSELTGAKAVILIA